MLKTECRAKLALAMRQVRRRKYEFLPDDLSGKRYGRWSCGHLFLYLSAFPIFHLSTIPRRWHTRTAPQALQRRFCVPSVTFLWEWNMKCVLEVCLGRVGCAIVLSGSGGLWDVRAGLAIRARSCNSPWAAT